MERYIEFEEDIFNDLVEISLIKRFSKIRGLCKEIEIDFPKEPKNNLKRATVRLKGNFDPCELYSIITGAGYTITKIGHQRFN